MGATKAATVCCWRFFGALAKGKGFGPGLGARSQSRGFLENALKGKSKDGKDGKDGKGKAAGDALSFAWRLA